MTNWTARLIGGLTDEGYSVRAGEKANEYVIEGFKSQRREVPLLLRADPRAVERYIARISTSAAALYPDTDPMEAGYRLMTIHLDEELNGLTPMQEVSFEGDRLRAVQVDGWKHPLADLPPGDYHWTTTRPDADGVVREGPARRRR